ncbi:MAG: CMP-binding protein [Clostridiales Family XIII bacterium]|jgi:3'-5' exoribonuclease|nr:CMP-binding protein [Clostridiales Family XIII bacterium]
MKDVFISTLQTGDDFTSYFLLKEKNIREDSRGKNYLDLLLGDSSGDIQGKKWDIPDEEIDALSKLERGGIIKVRAVVTEWNGAKQLKVLRIRQTSAEDTIDRRDYFKAAPEDPAGMYDFVKGRAEGIADEDFRKVALHLLETNREKLLYYPAAAKNHHAEYAGLLWHMKRMLLMAERWAEIYTFINRDILVCGVISHDMEKLNEMISDENGFVSEYSFEGVLIGHLVQGAATMAVLARDLSIPDEKRIMLEHMLISHHYEPAFGSPKRPMFPEAEALHYLDMIDAKMYDFEDALAGVSPGGFSERTWTLDNRRLYKRTF